MAGWRGGAGGGEGVGQGNEAQTGRGGWIGVGMTKSKEVRCAQLAAAEQEARGAGGGALGGCQRGGTGVPGQLVVDTL